MPSKMQNGFTLIELLVVIAIIGVLASVVIASLSTARVKSADAAIKADLAGLRATAEVQYDSLGQFYNTSGTDVAGSDCGSVFTASTFLANPSAAGALAHIRSTNGGIALYCNVKAASYAIAVTLKSGQFWCIDNASAPKGTQGTTATAYTAQSGSATAALTDNADVTCN